MITNTYIIKKRVKKNNNNHIASNVSCKLDNTIRNAALSHNDQSNKQTERFEGIAPRSTTETLRQILKLSTYTVSSLRKLNTIPNKMFISTMR